jgi:Arc/MetJ family transcription regulator
MHVDAQTADRAWHAGSRWMDGWVAPDEASDDATFDAHPELGIAMRTTINIDDALLAKAAKLAGPLDRSAVVHEGLKALIERESARRLARLGGSQPALKAAPRRRRGVKA